jgi:hypothetical protein
VSSAATSRSSDPSAVTTMIGHAIQCLSRRQTSMPSESGRPRSSSTTSGSTVAIRSSAAAAVGASTTRYPDDDIAAAIIVSWEGSSSTTRTIGPSARAASNVRGTGARSIVAIGRRVPLRLAVDGTVTGCVGW